MQQVLKSGYVEMIAVETKTVAVTDAMGDQVVIVMEKGQRIAVPEIAKDQLLADGVAEDVPSEE